MNRALGDHYSETNRFEELTDRNCKHIARLANRSINVPLFADAGFMNDLQAAIRRHISDIIDK